jgi:hypothetical protein
MTSQVRSFYDHGYRPKIGQTVRNGSQKISTTGRRGRRFSAPVNSGKTGGTSAQIEAFDLITTKLAVRALSSLHDNWDGSGSSAPDAHCISRALSHVSQMYAEVKASSWRAPHVSASENGEVSFEWWNADRKLTVYFTRNGVEYIRVWGFHIEDEMSAGFFDERNSFLSAWEWLHEG